MTIVESSSPRRRSASRNRPSCSSANATSASYASVNLLYYPVPNVMIGGEVLWGDLEYEDGSTEDDTRVQFSVKYSWGKSF